MLRDRLAGRSHATLRGEPRAKLKQGLSVPSIWLAENRPPRWSARALKTSPNTGDYRQVFTCMSRRVRPGSSCRSEVTKNSNNQNAGHYGDDDVAFEHERHCQRRDRGDYAFDSGHDNCWRDQRHEDRTRKIFEDLVEPAGEPPSEQQSRSAGGVANGRHAKDRDQRYLAHN